MPKFVWKSTKWNHGFSPLQLRCKNWCVGSVSWRLFLLHWTVCNGWRDADEGHVLGWLQCRATNMACGEQAWMRVVPFFFYFLMLFFVWYSSASLYLALCIGVSAVSVALYMLTTPHVFSFRCKYAGLRGEIICLVFLGYLIEKGKLILSIRACWHCHVLLFTSLISAYMELSSIKIQGSLLSWGNGGIDSLQVIFIFGVVFFSLCPPGGAGEAAASGQPHPGSLWKCQNSQKWQLISIRKTYRRSPFISLFVCLFVF